jgi:dihydroorotate dehydrogenase (NAD+) catalytic subunit
VYKVFQKVNIPIIGIGGITKSEDVIEYMLAGATAVQIGTANYRNPGIGLEVLSDIKTYLETNKINSITNLIGGVH